MLTTKNIIQSKILPVGFKRLETEAKENVSLFDNSLHTLEFTATGGTVQYPLSFCPFGGS